MQQHQEKALRPYLTPLGAWALALGTCLGWGSFVVTSNTYLVQAGPWGSVFGLLLGLLIMVAIARNYHYMINCFPDAGGAYTYAKEAFGHDYGFLTAWFLGLTYVAIFWVNAASVPLFAHYFLGDMFRVGYLYTLFGYDVYAGEVLLTMVAILAAAAFCLRSRKVVMWVVIGFALLFTAGIAVCFATSAAGFGDGFASIEPAFAPDKEALSQIVLITCISQWAFVGFENISNSSEEFAFPRSKAFRIMVAALVCAAVLYVFVLLLSVTAYPPEYDSWLAYISDLGNLDGLKALPAFYVADHYLGDVGVNLLVGAQLGFIVTSLCGNIIALSRMLVALGRDSVIPKQFAGITRWGTPGRALMLIAVVSLLIPFLGRIAIGWIVDVTTIGAAIVYGIVSAAAQRVARARGDTVERAFGIVGVVAMVLVGLYLFVSNMVMSQTLASESFFLFAAWGILGFALFRLLLARDKSRRFGRSVVVWIALLTLVMFVTFTWMSQSVVSVSVDTMAQIHEHYFAGVPTAEQLVDHEFVEDHLLAMQDANARILLIAAALFALAPAMLLTSISHMSQWAQKSEEELDQTRSRVYTDPLTGLPSMTRFAELARASAQAMRDRGEQPVAVAFELAGMKDYRSEHGRAEGDELLCALADVLRLHFGDTGCSRSAEDHFYAIAPQSKAGGAVDAVFADFKAANGGSTLPIRAGAYACSPSDDIAEVGFDHARAACDQDEKTWQSHMRWYSVQMGDEAKMRLHVLDHVDQAIEQGWVRPFYQAVVDARTGEVCSAEALARWIDPELGKLSPASFIPILEAAGLLHKVDMHMVDSVLADAAARRATGVPDLPISVNISLRDLGQVDIAEEIIARVDAAGLPHDLLHVEFTESAASEDPALFKHEVDTLRDAGLEVWMDDFGSGYSSLNTLKAFDFDVVKLDMDFLNDAENEKTWDIIAGIVGIARAIGVRTLAEGVETEYQARRLAELGIDMLQGYHFARPEPFEA